MRRLIINADDLGLTAGVNRGIFECLTQGVVTSATLMANAACSVDAAAAVSSPSFSAGKPLPSIGCHVVLVDGKPVLQSDSIKTLVPNSTGSFRSSLVNLMSAAAIRRLDSSEIAAEAEAQLRKLQSAGVRLSHVDTHKHVHLHPAILKPLLLSAHSCGVRSIRNPFAPVKPLAFAHLMRRPHLWKRYTEVKILRGWEAGFRQCVADHGMVTTDGTFGIVSTGALDLRLFAAIIGCIPEGTWEFCCHPGYNDAALATVKTRLRDSRVREREVLTSSAARKIIEQQGIELISYLDLP
ncbi:MAG: ChbG/HpnK family deacetylase [Terriglobales bacterium]